jgi:two-component system, chemotaxis family, chemotaxis protein CheY
MGARTILVIDDDADLRDVVTEVLSEAGYDALAASGGREALHLLAEGARPALILLDMMMPDMNGRQFREEQTKNRAWSAIPTVVVSAYVDVAEAARELGTAGGLQKPVRMDALLQLVEGFVH